MLALTVTLPAIAVNSYQKVTVIKIDASVNAVGITGDADINGAASQSLAAQYDSMVVESNGTEWYITAQMP